VRPPRLELIGQELEDATRIIRQALETRIELSTSSAARNP
jgi:hypothetical protein